MKFKLEGLNVEFDRSEPAVIAIALYCDWWAQREIGHQLLVTDVDRSEEEYDREYSALMAAGKVPYKLGANGVRHYTGPKPHLYDAAQGRASRAMDFGVEHGTMLGPPRLKDATARRLAEHLNDRIRRPDGKKTAIYHDVGSGIHLHVQAWVV